MINITCESIRMKNDSAGGTIKHSHVGKICKGKQGHRVEREGRCLTDDTRPDSASAEISFRTGGLAGAFCDSKILIKPMNCAAIGLIRVTSCPFFGGVAADRSGQQGPESEFQLWRAPSDFEFFFHFLSMRESISVIDVVRDRL
ncbi:hypothetical protein [Pseudomonas uvaldensis]|uniref:hypothetical protein n=1 Tax=Pseudomonas uvaldensis TaxID=2878385 RepID=UPI001E441FD7|nr:hypothetical protein [Pseudomonas uvaldensis]MCE0464117.1 hypothetical protein [Pseudomonas uvaldensis]